MVRIATLLFTRLAFASEDQCSFQTRENTCFGGNTIKKEKVSDLDGCCRACSAEADCTHFTFTSSAGTCGLKKGTPETSSHTHCTSGILSGPSPTPPAPTPTPVAPTTTPAPSPPSPPSPGPAPASGVKYMLGGKCLSIGGKDPDGGHSKNAFELILTDCDSAVEWTETFTNNERGYKYGKSEITAPWKHADDGAVCLRIPNKGKKAGVDECEDKRSGNERPPMRSYWDPSYNAIVSVFKNPDYCLDADGDQLVSKLCSETSQWKRTGPPGPKPPLPPHQLTPAPLVGESSLFWPLVGGMTGINDKGYPDYWGNNQAEACRADRRVDGDEQCQWPAKSDVPMYKYKHKQSGPSGTMTRSQILQRALVWVSHNFAGQDNHDLGKNAVGVEGCSQGESRDVCPKFFHGGACCSMPAQAWNISYCIKNPGGMGQKINCDDLRPGDGLAFGSHHVALFASWVTPAKKHFNIYQTKGAANVAQRGRSEHLKCIRRKDLIEDVEPDNLDAIALPHEDGDEEEVWEFDGLDDPEPDDYNGECDHLPGLWRDEDCDAYKPTAEVLSEFFV